MKPLIDLPFLSHGHATLKDVEESIRFYRDFLGLDVVKTSPRTLVARLGSNTAIVGVTLGEKGLAKAHRPWLEHAHFGLDLAGADEVKDAFQLALAYGSHFNIQNVGDLTENDEGLSFMICDQDGNYWQILENAEDGYSRFFERQCDTKNALASFTRSAIDTRTSILKPRLMSHMTCEVINIEKSQALYEEMFGLECIRLGPKRMLGRLNSVAVIDFLETETKVREHKMHNHIGFDVAGPEIVDAAREIIVQNQQRFGFDVIHKTSGSHGSYGFTFSDLDNNAWQIEDYPRGGYYWMFEQGGDLENKFQPNVGGVNDWHELIDPETYEYLGVSNQRKKPGGKSREN
ncbi:MAG: VOC family protein [Pseudomonadota bacterium]|nr:VOC family protein [Pseudomonadota bacterium]